MGSFQAMSTALASSTALNDAADYDLAAQYVVDWVQEHRAAAEAVHREACAEEAEDRRGDRAERKARDHFRRPAALGLHVRTGLYRSRSTPSSSAMITA